MIGERLAELRKDYKMSQRDLAKRLDVSVQTISAYENDSSTPNDEMKIEIAKIFNISLDYLFGVINEELPLNRKKTMVLPAWLPKKCYEEVVEYVNYQVYKRDNGLVEASCVE